METIIPPKSPNKLHEIKGVLKALKVDFEVKQFKRQMDKTAYLSSSPANKKRLNDSIYFSYYLYCGFASLTLNLLSYGILQTRRQRRRQLRSKNY